VIHSQRYTVARWICSVLVTDGVSVAEGQMSRSSFVFVKSRVRASTRKDILTDVCHVPPSAPPENCLDQYCPVVCSAVTIMSAVAQSV
jgi:hypothetical protein